MKDIIIRELVEDDNKKVAIFTYSGTDNPKTHLDEAVREYTKGRVFNQFIDAELDNPWIRVVVIGINELEQRKYEGKN